MQKNFKVVLAFVMLLAFSQHSVFAQDSGDKKWNHEFGLSISAGDAQFTPALEWGHLYGLGEKKKFQIGYGVRYSLNFGSDQIFTPAPPDLVTDEAVDDELTVDQTQISSLNAVIRLRYNISSKLYAGFNIDAIGFSMGGEQDATLTSSELNEAVNTTVTPTSANILLVGANDFGSLQSHFLVGYHINEKWGLQGGFSYTFTEYTTDGELVRDNDRFRRQTGMGFLKLTYGL